MSPIRSFGILLIVLVLTALGAAAQPPVNPSPRKPTPGPTPESKLMSKMPTPTNDAERLLLREYGAMFAAKGVRLPDRIFFKNEAEVEAFQRRAGEKQKTIGRIVVALQEEALEALEDAIEDAGKARLTITPRGADSAKRGYEQTVKLWASRVEPGLKHWVAKGKVSAAEAARIRSLTPAEQVPEILSLESKGIYFAKSLNKSIIYSVAPPGSSQHLAMLALDVAEFDDPRVRSILARNGWFQTVVSDLPHFTYLGLEEEELPSRGLKKVIDSGRTFWVPAMR
jgi:hypothetical protein